MSTSEAIPLQAVSDKAVEDDKRVESQGQITSQGTSSSTAAPSKWKKILTAVATLIAYAFLNAGISMIAPFYPIVVSCEFIDGSSCSFPGIWKFNPALEIRYHKHHLHFYEFMSFVRLEPLGQWNYIVSCPARARLPARNGLVNEVEFLGLVTQNR